MQAFLLVGLGGAIGAIARYGTGLLMTRMGGTGFPWGTLVVNVLGSFLMGLLISWLAQTTPEGQNNIRLFAAIGVLGGFTTFSSFSLDFVTLFERGDAGPAFLYAAASVLASILALFAALWITRGVWA